MIWVVLAIFMTGIIIAKAIYDTRKVDNRTLEEIERDKEMDDLETDMEINGYVVERFNNDAKKIYEFDKKGLSDKEIAKQIDFDEEYVRNLRNTSYYRNLDKK